jgi:transcriptional regulator with XRE-family HTH domain
MGSRSSNPDRALIFGRALAVLRLSRGLSRRELAQEARMSARVLSSYERGLMRPHEERLGRILVALDLPPEALDRAQEFARHPLGIGPLPADEEPAPAPEMTRQTALRLAQEVGKSFAHVTLALLELKAGGWQP